MNPFVRAGIVPFSFCLMTPALAQETTPPTTVSPTAGKPLPEFTIHFKEADTSVPGGEGTLGTPERAVFKGDVRLVWGDVRLRADEMSYDSVQGIITGTGNIVLVRGDETIRGESIVFYLATATFTVKKGVAVSPPYFVSGERIERTTSLLRISNGVVTPDPKGKGELRLQAREILVATGQYTDFSDLRVYVYGQRVLTLPHYRIRQQNGVRRSEFPNIPLRVKYTRLSGLSFGLENAWTLSKNANADAVVFFPSKNGPQYSLTATYDLLGTANEPPPFLRRRLRDSIFDAMSGGKKQSQQVPTISPLRHFLTIQPTAGYDPILDFKTILEAPEALARPLEESPRFALASATFSDREENGLKRQGNLFLSRQPEARVQASFPLRTAAADRGIVFETNSAARHYLSMPRFAIKADLTAGSYTERRISLADELQEQTPFETVSDRIGGEVGVNLLPLLLGKSVLFQSHLTYRYFRYDGSNTYRVPEIGASAAYVAGSGILLGAALYQRSPSGQTPFLFDRIDTQSEAQALMQTPISKRITVAGLVRYDLGQARLFDWGYTIGIRGRGLEPRFSYRKLGGQLSFGVHFVGL